MRTAGLFLCCYATAFWLPVATGVARWILLGAFMGMIFLCLREVGRS